MPLQGKGGPVKLHSDTESPPCLQDFHPQTGEILMHGPPWVFPLARDSPLSLHYRCPSALAPAEIQARSCLRMTEIAETSLRKSLVSQQKNNWRGYLWQKSG